MLRKPPRRLSGCLIRVRQWIWKSRFGKEVSLGSCSRMKLFDPSLINKSAPKILADHRDNSQKYGNCPEDPQLVRHV